MFEDRIYQDECVDTTLAEYDKGSRRMMHVMATGTGKTIVIGKLFEKLRSRLPGQMVVLAHTEKLVEQNADKTQKVNPHLKVGIDMGASHYADTDSDIISASIATLGRDGSKRVERFNWNNIDKLIADEAHHSTGDSYRRVFDAFGSFVPDTHKLTLGFTATPNRPDGVPLSDVYQKVGFVYAIRQAIKDGWLVQPRGYRVKTSTSLAGVSVVKGDYNKTELSAAVDSKPRNEQIVDTWKKYGENRSTLAYCVDIQHSKDLAQAFKDAGVPAEATWGDDPDQETKIKAHEAGEFAVLCNCNLLTEGYDNWKVSCIILARPTVSEILFTQMVGRGLRLDPNHGNLRQYLMKLHGANIIPSGFKQDCIVFDVVDNSSRHSLLTLPTLMGIRTDLDLRGRSLMACVEEMEAALEQCPSLDLSKLDSIEDLKTTVENVNLFDIKFPAEVEQNSELTWFRAVGGGYKMLIPGEKQGWIRLNENALGQWELIAEINEEPLHGVRDSMEAAFKVADEQIRKRVSSKTLACLKREGTWQNTPVRKKQIDLIKRIYKGRHFAFEQMTAGQASKLIGERLNKWDKN